MPTNNNLDPYRAKSVRHGMKHFLYGRAIQGVFSFMVMVVLARYMSVANYAAYVTATGLATLLAVLSMLGMDRVTTRYLPEGRIKATSTDLRHFVKRMRGVRAVSVVALSVIVLTFWDHFSALLSLGGGTILLSAILAYSFTHAIASYQRITLQSLMLQEGLRKATSLIWFLRLGGLLGLVVFFKDLTVEQALYVTAISELVGLIWMSRIERLGILHAHVPSTALAEKSWPGDWSVLYRFGLQNYLIQLIGLLTQAQSLRLLAAIFLSPPVVAAYGFFQSLAENVRQYLPLQLFRTMFEPVALAHHAKEGNFRRLNDMISTMLKLNMLVIAPMAVWFYLAAAPVIGLMTGGKYTEYSWILAASMVPIGFATHFSLILIAANAVGLSGSLLWGSVLGALSAFVLMIIALADYGLPVLIASAALASASANWYAIRAIRRSGFDYRVDWRRLARIIIFAMVGGLLAWLASEVGFERELVAGSIQAMIVCGFTFILLNGIWRPFYEAEKLLLTKLAGSKAKWIPF